MDDCVALSAGTVHGTRTTAVADTVEWVDRRIHGRDGADCRASASAAAASGSDAAASASDAAASASAAASSDAAADRADTYAACAHGSDSDSHSNCTESHAADAADASTHNTTDATRREPARRNPPTTNAGALQAQLLSVNVTAHGRSRQVRARIRLGAVAGVEMTLERGARSLAHLQERLLAGVHAVSLDVPADVRAGRYELKLVVKFQEGATRVMTRAVLLR